MNLLYCYDAYCGWCFGFSPVMQKIAAAFHDRLPCEVISGGMIRPAKPTPISVVAPMILKTYPIIEERTGVRFGSDFLWHINHAEESDWYPNSEKPAIALCILKEYYPDRAVEIAADLQNALNVDGRDLTDDEAYRHLLEKYSVQPETFFNKLHSAEYKQQAEDEFAFTAQLRVAGFPALFLQKSETKFHLLVNGYADFDTVASRLVAALSEQ